MPILRTISLHHPVKLVCGCGATDQCAVDVASSGFRRALLMTASATPAHRDALASKLREQGSDVVFCSEIDRGPTLSMFEELLCAITSIAPDVIIGLGGGSVLDVAKLVASLLNAPQGIRDVFGINFLRGRTTHLVCVPTTSGTGSEVSPNAILLDEDEHSKKGVISPWLVPDGTYIDPQLMVTMPPSVTAGTAMDALTHCIEAYGNKFAHPMVDLYALEGVRLIARNLPRVMDHPHDLEGREQMAIASLYGGLCLGPVNTAAVHALSYPLGSVFHLPHGLSNAILLPHVLKFNLTAAPERYATIALAMGVEPGADSLETASRGIVAIRKLADECGIVTRLSELHVSETTLLPMAESAMKGARLLKNNPRELTLDDALAIYRNSYA